MKCSNCSKTHSNKQREANKKSIFLPTQKKKLLSFPLPDRLLQESYHGLVKENETIVEITPLIRIDGNKICQLEIVKSTKEIPFKVRVQTLVG